MLDQNSAAVALRGLTPFEPTSTSALRNPLMRPVFATTILCLSAAGSASAQEYLNGIEWKKPEIVTPASPTRLRHRTQLYCSMDKTCRTGRGAEKWKIDGDAMVVGKGAITSKDEFGDCQVHIEWSAPTPPTGTGQGRGNSGLFLMGRYELQILDSYENETYYDGQAGAIYKQTPPLANATRAPGQWNTYDVFWTAPRFNEDGSLKSPAYITAYTMVC